MLRSIQVLDRRYAVGQNAFTEYLRYPVAQKYIALRFTVAAETALDMNVSVDQPGHKRISAAVNNGHSRVFNGSTADFLNDLIFYKNILMKQFVAVADNDMDIPDQISRSLFLLRAEQVFDQNKQHEDCSEQHLDPSDQRNSE